MQFSDNSHDSTANDESLGKVLAKLVDLTLQVQHIRWNLPDDEALLRQQLDDFDALVRAGADEIALHMRQTGLTPDGRVEALQTDPGFPPLATGPFRPTEAVKEFIKRLATLAAEIRDTVAVVEQSDPDSALVLRSFSEELLTWTDTFKIPA